MRLLRIDETSELSLTEDLAEEQLPPYAILSHRWFANSEEPTFADLVQGGGKQKLGYNKLPVLWRASVPGWYNPLLG